jgi:hypothetical protein
MTADEFKAGLVDTLLRVADRFGVPCVILAVVIWFGREAAIALHDTLVRPVVESHIEFLDTTRETLSEISSVQHSQAMTLQELANGQKSIRETLQTVTIVSPEAPPAN